MTDQKRKTLTIGAGATGAAKKPSSAVVVRRRRIFRPDTPTTSGKSANTEHLKNLLSKAKKENEDKEKERQLARDLDDKRRQLAQEDQLKTEKVQEKLAEKIIEEAIIDPDAIKEDKRIIDKTKEKKTEDYSDRKEKKSFKDSGRRKLTVKDIVIGEDGEISTENRRKSVAALRRRLEKNKQAEDKSKEEIKHGPREIIIPETITVKDLATRLSEKSGAVVKKLMEMGTMATVNQVIDADTAELVIAEFGHTVKRVGESEVVETLLKSSEKKDVKEVSRAPVVTIMGHVDHGKTTLLDALRETDVVSGEAGGITQHIGAYQVEIKSGDKITFIDTPGHAAFSAMRSRGAKVTDIVVLVVAANDGIKPQTIEAISHAKSAGVPLIVAINKIDLPDANPQKVKTELLSHDVVVEEMSGDVQCVEISAKNRLHLDKLEEAILLQAEILDLKAQEDCAASGSVVESRIEKGLGATATVLISKGTLKVGDIFVSGMCAGRVRALRNSYNKTVKSATVGEPIVVLGYSTAPIAGDDFVVLDNEAKSREIAEYRTRKHKEKEMIRQNKTRMETLMAGAKAGKVQTLAVILKADVQGSAEAIVETAQKIKSDKIKVNFIHSAVGGINESDITLAKTTDAIIIGFNVRANAQARDTAKNEGIDIRYYSIIYDVIDDFKAIMEGMLEPEIKETITGYADILQVFTVGKGTKVAGCRVSEGTIKREGKIRLIRNDIVLYEGEIGEMKHGKQDANEAKNGTECGLSFAKYNDIAEGDKIECFTEEKLAIKL
ncbi:MAG: translation initiation factor IF-2 [Alphaproteobacteria bacterium]|nr:translation initiation factor IF-2 [Alphaproteobacteria bacterium]MBN2779833.1 translation initiation factor IF-2 [Alphaproteobacteria bacterium]